MELVGLGGLAHVKLGLPLGNWLAADIAALAILSAVAVKVVKETEEGRERGLGGVVESAREESHCDC